jgi:hypothetical protein
LDMNYRCQPHGEWGWHPPDPTAVPRDPSRGTGARGRGAPKDASPPRVTVGYQSGFD